MNLSGRKILLIGIGFYDYEYSIKQLLEENGAKVDYFISNYISLWIKLLLTFRFNKLIARLRARRIHSFLKSVNDNYDIILIIKGECFDEDNFILLKRKFYHSKFIFYLWDSLNRLENRDFILKHFTDDIYTFDRLDALAYNLKFRPLFYRRGLSKTSFTSCLYDISFVGTNHSDRYRLLSVLKDYCEDKQISYKFVLTITWREFLIDYYILRRIKKQDKSFFLVGKISYDEYLNISLSSNVIFDISHPMQSGLTMRTIESIGLCRKVLTTNCDIVNYNQIPSSNYCVFDRNNIKIPNSFLSEKVMYLHPIEYFSLDFFLKELFEETVN